MKELMYFQLVQKSPPLELQEKNFESVIYGLNEMHLTH